MLSKAERLTQQEVERVLSLGKRRRGAFFSVAYIPAHQQKYAVVVSKKTAKTAVTRNHMRRQVYTLLKTTLPTTGHSKEHVIIFVLTNTTTIGRDILQNDLRNTLPQ